MPDVADRLSRRFIGAVEDEWQLYSDNPADYTVGPPIGFGASSIVYSAQFNPASAASSTPCALKVLDLDSLPPHALALLQRETRLMSLNKHPNVLRVRGTWIDGHKLYIALRLMNKGSAADVMRYAWPGGMEEEVVRCILRQALEGLNYLHINGFIHRDIKAANLLIDDDGTVLLGDLGVAADLSEGAHHDTKHHHAHTSVVPSAPAPKRTSATIDPARPVPVVRPKYGKRMSFVGTPCWMAPELIQGKHYDSSADIWSFAITALELSQGRPPRSREAPSKVLLGTVKDAPPVLDRDGGQHKYSRTFQEVVESCLVKDPSKRPTAEHLLQTPFFRSAKKKSYLVNTILKDLPPLAARQERRATVPRAMLTHGTVDSWDFGASVVGSVFGGAGKHSPTASMYKRTSSSSTLEDLARHGRRGGSSSRRGPSVDGEVLLESPPSDDAEDVLTSEPEPSAESDTNVAQTVLGTPPKAQPSKASSASSSPRSDILSPLPAEPETDITTASSSSGSSPHQGKFAKRPTPSTSPPTSHPTTRPVMLPHHASAPVEVPHALSSSPGTGVVRARSAGMSPRSEGVDDGIAPSTSAPHSGFWRKLTRRESGLRRTGTGRRTRAG